MRKRLRDKNLPSCILVSSADQPTRSTWGLVSSDGRWSTFRFSSSCTGDKLRVLYMHRYSVNILDLIQRRFSYGHYGQPESNMPDLTSCIWFSSILPRKPGSYCAKPAPILSGWPDQLLAKCIWFGSKLVFMNQRAWFWHNATSLLPVSHFQTRMHSSTDDPDHRVQNQPRPDFVLAGCVWFGPNGFCLEAS